MKIGSRVLIISCLLAFYVFIQSSFAKVDFVFERLTIPYMNTKYGKFSASVFRFNRSAMAMNLSLTLFKTSTPDMRFRIEIYKFDGGAYKRTALQLDQDLCHFLNGQYKIIFGSYLKDGYMKEFVQECPVPPGVYAVHNAGIPPMPPSLPAWRVLCITKLYKPSEPLLEVHSYINFKERTTKKN